MAHTRSQGTLFLQRAILEPVKDQLDLIAHSASFLHIAADHPAARAIARNSRQTVETNPDGWLPQAGMTFLQCARTEHDDEGPVIYWTTWYLDGVRRPLSTESRLLRLDVLQHHWFGDLCEL